MKDNLQNKDNTEKEKIKELIAKMDEKINKKYSEDSRNKFKFIPDNKMLKMIYNITIELASGIIVAIILKKIFNIQNKLIFGIIVLLCTCGSLYNLLKRLHKE
jgi:hypothetical protein